MGFADAGFATAWANDFDADACRTFAWKFGEGETRRLSCRECAAIQTFPVDVEFTGNPESRYRQVGNAVPPRLARAVAAAVRQTLEDHHV